MHFCDLKLSIEYSLEVNHYVLVENIETQQALLEQFATCVNNSVEIDNYRKSST